MPYRVHFRLGPSFRLQLLPTPSCDDAVAFDCMPVSASGMVMTFTFRVHGFMDALGAALCRDRSRDEANRRGVKPLLQKVPQALEISRVYCGGADVPEYLPLFCS